MTRMTTPEEIRDKLRTLDALAGPLPEFDTRRSFDTPMHQFMEWLQAAIDANAPEPHAMVLSTVDEHGSPDSRVLLLKDLDDDGWHPNFWVSKLHFYISSLPFYNFPYTFGYLLSLGIYAMASDFGDQFAQRYGRFLLATGSCETEEAVKTTLGCDLTQPAFWNRSLDIVERRVERFLELAK